MEFDERERDHSRRKITGKEAIELGHKYQVRLGLWVFQVGEEGCGRQGKQCESGHKVGTVQSVPSDQKEAKFGGKLHM